MWLTVIAGAIAAIASVLVAILQSASSDIKKQNVDLKRQIEEANVSVAKMRMEMADQIARREQIVSDLKAELLEMEEDLAKASTPAAVRARLSKLFP